MRTFISAITTLSVFSCADIHAGGQPPALTLKVEQLTAGNRHHFFGYIGGHPEWDLGNILIGRKGNDQILYNVDRKKIVGKIGSAALFPNPEGDISLSPDGRMFVNGYKRGNKNHYAVYRRTDGAFGCSKGLDKGSFSGDIRIDPALRWNRANNAILVPGLAENQTRQIFLIRVEDAR